jgi:hypothetical protein
MNGIYLWTDSTVVLHWLHRAPNFWKTFVANRVAEIQDLTSVEDWRHVISSDNPADYVSHGVDPRSLKSLDHWWSGPVWLHDYSSDYESTVSYDLENVPESKNSQVVSLVVETTMMKYY